LADDEIVEEHDDAEIPAAVEVEKAGPLLPPRSQFPLQSKMRRL